MSTAVNIQKEDTHKTKLLLDLELVGHGVLGKGGALVTGADLKCVQRLEGR